MRAQLLLGLVALGTPAATVATPADAAAAASPPVACAAAIAKACGTAARTDCLVCCGGHGSTLHAAGCNQTDFSSFCNGNHTPAPPRPVVGDTWKAEIHYSTNTTSAGNKPILLVATGSMAMLGAGKALQQNSVTVPSPVKEVLLWRDDLKTCCTAVSSASLNRCTCKKSLHVPDQFQALRATTYSGTAPCTPPNTGSCDVWGFSTVVPGTTGAGTSLEFEFFSSGAANTPAATRTVSTAGAYHTSTLTVFQKWNTSGVDAALFDLPANCKPGADSAPPVNPLPAAAAVAAAAAARPLPHIFVLIADDLGWGSVGWHRQDAGLPPSPEVQTPHLDALAAGGIDFSHHYGFKSCSPSRCSFQTGRLPVHVLDANTVPESFNPNNTVSGYAGIPVNMTTIAWQLKKAGYTSHFVGKVRQSGPEIAAR